MMRRRDVISLLGGAAAANSLATWPLAARAQQASKIRNVAWLGVGQPDQPSPYLESLRAGLRELGWVEGRNLKLGTFWATGLDDMAGGGAAGARIRSRGGGDAGIHGDCDAAVEGGEAGRVRIQQRPGRRQGSRKAGRGPAAISPA